VSSTESAKELCDGVEKKECDFDAVKGAPLKPCRTSFHQHSQVEILINHLAVVINRFE
tara:strand:- start:547 stop:720 length:174 start_codon:yes stop_codon:yes gene_type:complete